MNGLGTTVEFSAVNANVNLPQLTVWILYICSTCSVFAKCVSIPSIKLHCLGSLVVWQKHWKGKKKKVIPRQPKTFLLFRYVGKPLPAQKVYRVFEQHMQRIEEKQQGSWSPWNLFHLWESGQGKVWGTAATFSEELRVFGFSCPLYQGEYVSFSCQE